MIGTPSLPPSTEKWYDHKAEAVSEKENVKLLRDFSIQTDKVIQARRPDVTLSSRRRKIKSA